MPAAPPPAGAKTPGKFRDVRGGELQVPKCPGGDYKYMRYIVTHDVSAKPPERESPGNFRMSGGGTTSAEMSGGELHRGGELQTQGCKEILISQLSASRKLKNMT